MANLSTIRPDSAKIPREYPLIPTVGKIELIYNENKSDLYHRISPYTYDTFLGLETREPFLYKYADDRMSSLEKYCIREFPFSRAVKDVERIGKFLISGRGILWLGKQFLLQTGNAFNETRLYNPTSPLLGAAMPLSFWAFRPQRHLDLSSVSSIVTSFLGPSIGSIFSTKSTPPVGTVGLAGLPANNKNAGKGLLRAGTANKAMVLLKDKWSGPNYGAGLGLGGFLSQTIKGLFGNFLPQRQPSNIKRMDEGTYELMLSSYTGAEGVFSYQSVVGVINGAHQFWVAGSSEAMRKNGGLPKNWNKLYMDVNGKPMFRVPSDMFQIPGLCGPIGYSILNTDRAIKYGDYIGIKHGDEWENSDLLIQYSFYADAAKKYNSKFTDKANLTVRKIADSLQNVINKINSTGIYQATSSLISNKPDVMGYDRIVSMKAHNSTEGEYRHSTLKEYFNNSVRVLDNKHTDRPDKNSAKLAGAQQFDGINVLTVLDASKKTPSGNGIENWNEWNAYRDDIIAFYFYDVVNQRYIPFRATIQGLQETDNVSWEELSFIGRADRLYSYGGFTRSLTFNFSININSIVELGPTWQRINYLMGLTKPASYTQNTSVSGLNLPTRYIVPPMVMITIGDLYKNQPILINSIGLSIPNTALWETLNEHNSTTWHYLGNHINSSAVKGRYGQLPKTVDVSISAALLEKERAITGAAHFGHAPRTEEYEEHTFRATAPDDQLPDEFDKFLSVYQKSS